MVEGVLSIPLPAEIARSRSAGRDSLPPLALRAFWIGQENRLAKAAVESVLGTRPNRYHPLVLVGPSGVGKSHLARGLARQWPQRRGNALVTTGVEWARELAQHVERSDVGSFRTRYRQAGLLVLDDVAGLAKKPTAAREFLVTLDALSQAGGLAIVTARVPVIELPGLPDGLVSRLAAGLVVPLAMPQRAARQAILQELALAQGIPLSPSAAQLLARELNLAAPGLWRVLIELSQSTDVVDADVAREYLADRLRRRKPILTAIVSATASHFSLEPAQLKSAGRNRTVVMARGVAMYLARKLTRQSFEKIGKSFGGRDHSTVLHNYRKIEHLIETDPPTRQTIGKLTQLFETV